MDLYQMTKYQSISDRIKRLASGSNPPTHSFQSPPSSKVRMFQSPSGSSFQKKEYELPSSLNFMQKLIPSRVTTQETQGNQDQQSQTLINELLSIRESMTGKIPKREIRQAMTEEVDEKSFMNETEKEKIVSRWRKEGQNAPKETKKRGLSHVKSQSSLKIQEIMESYKSYKQNKQQFLAEVGQNSKEHQRVISQNLSNYFEQEERNTQDNDLFINRPNYRQSHIESLWNEAPQSRDLTTLDRETAEDNEPKFQRTTKGKLEDLAQFTQLKTKQSRQFWQDNKKPKLNNSKLILKNIKVQKQPIKQVSTNINLMLSPRGFRVPGKICKNSDKSLVAQPRLNE